MTRSATVPDAVSISTLARLPRGQRPAHLVAVDAGQIAVEHDDVVALTVARSSAVGPSSARSTAMPSRRSPAATVSASSSWSSTTSTRMAVSVAARGLHGDKRSLCGPRAPRPGPAVPAYASGSPSVRHKDGRSRAVTAPGLGWSTTRHRAPRPDGRATTRDGSVVRHRAPTRPTRRHRRPPHGGNPCVHWPLGHNDSPWPAP